MPDHPLSTLRKLDPEFMKHLEETDALVYADGALPRKVKLLMAMAFDAAEGAAGGVRALAEQAMKAGATKEEIAETLRVAFHLG
jgi:alkylhydroperoxidase/carboxymuconolactone decarboxylase family protein YurZ